jgi:hypothetical protein
MIREQRSIRAGEGIKRRQLNCLRRRILGNGIVWWKELSLAICAYWTKGIVLK